MPCFIVPIYDESNLTIKEMALNVARIRSKNSIASQSSSTTIGYQIRSPSLVLYHQHGSSCELAIMLCSLFIGRGLRAYVAIGSGNNRANNKALFYILYNINTIHPTYYII